MKHLGCGAFHFCSNDDPSTVAAKVIFFSCDLLNLKGNGLPLTFRSKTTRAIELKFHMETS